MKRAIEIHDSIVEQITIEGGTVTLHFSSVFIHQSDGEPAWDAGSVWSQEARLYVAGATVVGGMPELPVDLWDGELEINGRILQNAIPIPLNERGAVRLKLQGSGTLKIRGTQVQLELLGAAEYVENFSGNRTTES